MQKHTFKDWHEAYRHQEWVSFRLPYWELGWRYYGWKVWKHLRLGGYLGGLKYYLACRWWRKYNTFKVDTLPPTWYDRSEGLVHVMFHVFCEVMEKEDWFNDRVYFHADTVDGPAYDYDFRDEWQEAAILYDWWKNRRPARLDAEERALSAWGDEFRRFGGLRFKSADEHGLSKIEFPNERHTEEELSEERRLFMAHTAAEEAGEAEDEQMMIRLVKLRGVLWT